MSRPAAEHGTIVVPGSISNLGPAFDALSVAVTVYLRIRVDDVRTQEPGDLRVTFDGTPPAGENRIVTAFERAKATFGDRLPGLSVTVSSDIPVRAGLGSSAAATVAGLLLYESVTGPRPNTDWLGLATDIEGHPDNAAAALLGGLALSCQYDDGRVDAWSWEWPSDLRFVVATPGAELETAFARKVLPSEISRRDAVFNLQRALLLVRSLESGDYVNLREALRDRWHQPFRQSFVPGLADALAIDDPAVLGVCLSGSGPSIAVVTDDREAAVSARLGEIYGRLGLPYTIRTLASHPPSRRAARVSSQDTRTRS